MATRKHEAAQRLRERAERARTMAVNMADAEAKRLMLRVAENFEKIADAVASSEPSPRKD